MDISAGRSETDACSEEDSFNDSSETPSTQLTTWEAGWNVTNAIQGIFVLSLPYALLHSGYCGLLLIILAPVFCCYTGKILISCLYEENEDGQHIRVRDTYEEIAQACCIDMFPKLAGTIVSVTQLIELIMTCILYLVVSGNLLCHSFPSIPVTEKAWSPIAFILLLPCVLIKDLKIVSRLSFLCSLAHLVIILLVVTYCLTQHQVWSWGKFRIAVDFENFLISVGVIIFSYTSQIYLPGIEGSMKNKAEFGSMLTWTHLLACVLKTVFALASFLTWGENTKEVISDNLPIYLETLANLCLLTKSLLSFPLPFYSAIEILNCCCSTTYLSDMVLRVLLLLLTLLLAVYIPHFALLMGLTGSVTGAAMTLLLPPFFHLKLKLCKLTMFEKCADVSMFCLGLLCSITGIVCSIKGLQEVFGTN
ncbi:vesicular inhibitory amino acid transporter-like [Discoglossus pictus]